MCAKKTLHKLAIFASTCKVQLYKFLLHTVELILVLISLSFLVCMPKYLCSQGSQIYLYICIHRRMEKMYNIKTTEMN